MFVCESMKMNAQKYNWKSKSTHDKSLLPEHVSPSSVMLSNGDKICPFEAFTASVSMSLLCFCSSKNDEYLVWKEYELNLFCPYVPVGQAGFGGFGEGGTREGHNSATFFKSLFPIIIIVIVMAIMIFHDLGYHDHDHHNEDRPGDIWWIKQEIVGNFSKELWSTSTKPPAQNSPVNAIIIIIRKNNKPGHINYYGPFSSPIWPLM